MERIEKGKTIYHCEYCSFKTDAIGKLLKHVFDNHHQHFNETCINFTQPKHLIDILPEDIRENEDYEKTLETPNILKVQYTDAYEKLNIQIDRHFNEYGVAHYTLWLTKIDDLTNDEIIYPESCHDCYEDCTYYDKETESCTIEEISNKEKEDWENKPNLTTKFGINELIDVYATIETIKCYLNILHYHYYKALEINAQTTDAKTITTIINAADIIFALYMEYLNKITEVKQK